MSCDTTAVPIFKNKETETQANAGRQMGFEPTDSGSKNPLL